MTDMSTRTAPQGRSAGIGAYGERVARRHLEAAGMRFLDANWRCEDGEIDLVMREGDLLVVVEVKSRTSDQHGDPLEAVGPEKALRLRRLAGRWVSEHAARPTGIRLDLVAVRLRSKGAAQVEHVRGVEV